MYTNYKNAAPCASILSLRLQCRKLKRWQRPLIRTWSKHCHGKKCFPTEARQKAFLVQGFQSGLKKLFRWIKSFDRHRYHNVIRSCLIELTGCDVTNFLYYIIQLHYYDDVMLWRLIRLNRNTSHNTWLQVSEENISYLTRCSAAPRLRVTRSCTTNCANTMTWMILARDLTTDSHVLSSVPLTTW